MTKIVVLKLISIKYTGDSVGDDIRIEVETLNRFVWFNKKIRKGSAVTVNKDIGEFFADGSSFILPVTIRIIERDLAFNDVGSKEVKIKVDLTTSSFQSNTHIITVQESRGFLGKKKAAFEIIMEAVVLEAIVYVALEQGKGGWTDVKREDTGERIALPAFLKVQLEKQDSQREYFEIREGILQGTKASVKIETDNISYLQVRNPHTGPVHLIYSLSKKTVKLNRNIYTVLSLLNDPKPWKKGLYDIEIPDAPHQAGENYLDRAKLAKVWFRIGHSGERYLHTGSVTLGCVTMTEVERWDDLCKILMNARKGDGMSVGVLEITD